ncbi:MAG: ABC transporter permease subunit [Hydrogeniiclostridium mannosilyticum]
MALFIGTFFGIITGMRSRGLLDTIIMRVIDVLMAFPFMVFAMVFAALWGTGLANLLIAVVAVWWVPFAGLARSIVLQVKNDPSQAARVLGASGWRMGVLSCSPR